MLAEGWNVDCESTHAAVRVGCDTRGESQLRPQRRWRRIACCSERWSFATSYANSWNAYDSLAEAHMNAGNNERAVELYEKSLELTRPTRTQSRCSSAFAAGHARRTRERDRAAG